MFRKKKIPADVEAASVRLLEGTAQKSSSSRKGGKRSSIERKVGGGSPVSG